MAINSLTCLFAVCACVFISPCYAELTSEQATFFENEIRPILVGHCVECHGAKKRESGLRLDTQVGFERGGESGAAISRDALNDSLLLKAVRREDGLEMPPDKPLSQMQVAAITKWVHQGAPWPQDNTADESAGSSIRSGPITGAERSFWSFQPIVRPSVPKVENERWCTSPVDNFVLSRLESQRLSPAEPADRRTLIRRATFDLTGLPPTREAIAEFVADESPDALAKLVDRLLDSSHYGERWARHWLDVVRYADTAGETADFPVPLAWRYRNYVIDSFNKDKPYDQFLKEQIAGDILAAHHPDQHAELVTATGYLAVARRFGFGVAEHMHLTIQDVIDTTGQAVMGLSLGCARCHDHKYDPVLASDYYAWYGIFESTQFALSADEKTKKERNFVPLVPFEEVKRIEQARLAREVDLKESLAVANQGLAQIQAKLGVRETDSLQGDFEPYFLGSEISEPWEMRSGTVCIEAQSPFSNVNPVGTRGIRTPNTDGNNGCGCKLPERTSDTHERLFINMDFRNVHANKPATGSTRIYVGQGPGLSAAIECYLYDNGFYVGDGFERKRVADIERGVWYNLQLTLNLRSRTYSGVVHSTTEQTVEFADVSCRPNWNGKIDRVFTDKYTFVEGVRPEQDVDNFTVRTSPLAAPSPVETQPAITKTLAKARQLGKQVIEIQQQQATLSRTPYELAYAVTEGTPKDAAIHKRGDHEKLGETVARRQLKILGGAAIGNQDTSSGRQDLAEWLASKDNPLTARVIANRIWQWHMGRGIVTTPNDFGKRGTPPSHPALLDWLAAELIDSDWSIKHLHRVIMNSQTYRLSSNASDGLAPSDELIRTQNFGRYASRRLDAESIRDAMLAVSGRLDRTPGEYHPFPAADSWGFTQHGPFYAVYETNKRSVYVMRQRLKAHPFFSLFDAADPSVSTASRDDTTTPTQALFLLNSPFVEENAIALADRVRAYDTDTTKRILFAWELVMGAIPSEQKIESCRQFIDRYEKRLDPQFAASDRNAKAWTAFCRSLLISNEFLFLE